MEPKLFVATKAFVIYNGKVLLVRESSQYADGANVGKFDVVGGRIKPGEHFDESLLREVKEESGLDIEIGRPFFVNEAWPVVRGEQWQIVRIFFRCTSENDKIILSPDHDAFLWIDPERYREHPIIENLVPVFEAYLRQK